MRENKSIDYIDTETLEEVKKYPTCENCGRKIKIKALHGNFICGIDN